MTTFRSPDEATDPGESRLERLQRGVVGLLVSYQEYDADRPWMKRYPATRFAQAAVVDGPYLLTTAQMVAGATMIEAEREGRPPRARVRVVHQDPELNLTLLAVDEPGFFDGLRPLELATSTPTGGTVETVRWRAQQFEVAATRVKRMVVGEVYFGRLRHAFLLGQTDLTEGGWAEPVVLGDRLIGISSGQDEQTAWTVPCELLGAYLAQARDPSRYVGFAVVRFAWQSNMDRALAHWLGQEGAQQGVVIRAIPRGSTGDGVLHSRDILLSLDGHPIDSAGYYRHPRFGRIEFTNIVIDGHRVGDVVPATVLRQGVEVELSLTLRGYTNGTDLIPLRRGNEPPPYAIVGGLVFVELDGDYLRTWGNEWWNRAPTRLVSAFYLEEGGQRPDRRRIIVLSHVLPSAITLGYHDCRDLPVHTIDGQPVDSIADVVAAFDAVTGPFVRVEFFANEVRREVVLDATTLADATRRILEDFGIPAGHRLAERAVPSLD
ncbi:MAG: hypothetical protein ABMB14_32605 [Myxococcota bacterium]